MLDFSFPRLFLDSGLSSFGFPTTRFLVYAYERLVGSPAGRLRPPFGEEFVFIGHYLFTLLFAAVTGYLTSSLFSPHAPTAADDRRV